MRILSTALALISVLAMVPSAHAAPAAKSTIQNQNADAISGSPLTPNERVAHVLDRLGYGGRPGDAEKLAQGGTPAIRAWLKAQMDPASIPDRECSERLDKFKTLRLSSAELMAQFPRLNQAAEKLGIEKGAFKKNEGLRKEMKEKIGETHLAEYITEEMRAQKIIRAVESDRQLQEVLTDFWFNHFNVDVRKNEIVFLLTSYERDSIRPHVFGKFSDLLSATAHSPAMMMYLDNNRSQSAVLYAPPRADKTGKMITPAPKPRKQGLNENYARELMELHTLGVDGGYTQTDVTELARILTGWTIANPKEDPQFAFNEKVHDRGRKVFLGHVFPEGRNVEEGEEALLLLAHHPKTAANVARALATTFVSDHPSDALVKLLSDRFLKSDGDLKAVYSELFLSREFWARESYRAKIKMPFHLLVSTVRALGGEVEIKSEIPKQLAAMGEELYACAPPTGYKDTSETWVNSSAMVSRLNAALQLSQNGFSGVYTVLPQITTPVRSPSELLGAVAAATMHDRISQGTEAVIESELKDTNIHMTGGEVRPLTLAKSVGLVLGSPEFQRH